MLVFDAVRDLTATYTACRCLALVQGNTSTDVFWPELRFHRDVLEFMRHNFKLVPFV